MEGLNECFSASVAYRSILGHHIADNLIECRGDRKVLVEWYDWLRSMSLQFVSDRVLMVVGIHKGRMAREHLINRTPESINICRLCRARSHWIYFGCRVIRPRQIELAVGGVHRECLWKDE